MSRTCCVFRARLIVKGAGCESAFPTVLTGVICVITGRLVSGGAGTLRAGLGARHHFHAAC